MTTKKKNIAVVCGGDSGEYEISIKSGKVVYAHLNKEKYNPWLIIVKGANWMASFTDGSSVKVDKDDFSVLAENQKIHFDAVFNVIHGTPGEDGKILGYFDMLGIPYTSSSHVVSGATFNKDFCKQLVRSKGVALADSVLVRKGNKLNSEQIIQQLGLPVFVKPNSNGSSVGVSKVTKVEELEAAVDNALKEDHEALIESYIKGREIGCGVFEFKGRKLVFPLTEIISKKEFFDYEAKYTPGMSDEVTPAEVDEAVEIDIKAIASELYSHLGCKGIVRFDFILTDNEIYFLEVNTVPGMSEASIIPQQAQVMGITLETLFDMAIENVL
ncbi:MAG: D-alanine-D-alanine ligase [Bacteroidetes bacterium]|nr:MAG: D-alanine-D-alanine ligase [Bacteroidota bacterium]